MSSITAIVLTFNESKHIERCLKSLLLAVDRVVVVDSGSNDETVQTCERLGADVYVNAWVNYASQFQWALENCDINSEWTMRMDADEFLEPELVAELNIKIRDIKADINAIYIKRKVIFKGQWIRFGGFYPHILLRIWRTGTGRIEKRWMDEHIVVENSRPMMLVENLVDENLNNIGWWTEKHNSYATRETLDLLNIKYNLFDADTGLQKTDDPQARLKRFLKERIYARLPIGFRPCLYFTYRYVLRFGFLDGRKGFLFHFLQGFWYRLLVDIKCDEVVKVIEATDGSKSDMIAAIKKETGINVQF